MLMTKRDGARRRLVAPARPPAWSAVRQACAPSGGPAGPGADLLGALAPERSLWESLHDALALLSDLGGALGTKGTAFCSWPH